MSYKHQGKLTIAPDFDWITGDSVGFEVIANLLKLSSWMEWMKIMKHWCKNNFFDLPSFLLKNLPSFPFLSPSCPSIHPPHPLLNLFLPPSLVFSYCTISSTDWLWLVKVYLNLIQMIVIGANFCYKKKERPFFPLNKLWQRGMCKATSVKLKTPCCHNLVLSDFAWKFPCRPI